MRPPVKHFLAFLLLCAVSNLSGQKKEGFIPPSIDDEDIPVAKTELPVPEAGEDYVVKYFKGSTDGVESRIAIKRMGYILRPAMVQVFSEDGRKLTVELVKKNWDDVVRSGNTENGTYTTSFKTAMEFGIKISAAEMGIPFIVAVSAGIELFPSSNLFVDAGTMRSGSDTSENITNMVGPETEKSNNTFLIILVGGLLVVTCLLVFFFLKRKAKKAATLILLLFALGPLNANVVTGVSGSAVGKMAIAIANALAKHYGNGNFNKDDILHDDDKDHEPDMDPRGQPTLPSSCYNIARISQSRGSSGGGSAKGGNSAKNPNSEMGPGGNAGESAGNTISLDRSSDVGGSAGANAGDSAAPNASNDSGNEALNQALEEARIEYENLNIDTEKSFQEGLVRAESTYEHITGLARDDYNTARQAASGNPEEQARLATEFANRIAELTSIKSQRIAELIERKNNMLVQNAAYYANKVASIMAEYGDGYAEGSDGSSEGKDPDPDPQKNKDREDESKGSGKGGRDTGYPDGPGGPGSGDPKGGDPDEDNKSEGCDCLERAYRELQDNRYTLEKLLKIGQHTKKVTDFGISFGDNFSGIHGVSGLAWQTERAKVIKSIEKFDKTYNSKYKELIDKLYNTLIWIDDCEKQLGYENWYSHSGFIYYEFMKVRYASYK